MVSIVIAIGIILILSALAGLLIFLMKQKKRHQFSDLFLLRQKTLRIVLPKESSAQETSTWNIENTRSAIATMESFLSSIAGLHADKKLREKKTGRLGHVSFEIVSLQKEIYFYVIVPHDLLEFIKQNIQAVFPTAHIEDVPPYNLFQHPGFVHGISIQTIRNIALPLKTYQEIETDPLDALTNALSKLEETEGAVIQYIIKSAPKTWRKVGVKVAEEMQKGTNFQNALKVANRNMFANTVTSLQGPKKKKSGENPYPDKRELSPQEIEMVRSIETKNSKAGLLVNIRIVVSSQNEPRSVTLATNIANSFNQFNSYEYGNKLEMKTPRNQSLFIKQYIYRQLISSNFILNTEEFASLFHFPTPVSETPNIYWLKSKKAAPPINLPKEGLILGNNVYRNKIVPVRISPEDRRRHMHIIGMTGVGKSVLLQEMARQDIEEGRGVGIIDPHGDLAESLLAIVPEYRMKDVIYFNPADIKRPLGLNMLEAETVHEQDFAIQEMIQIFYKLVADPSMIGPMFEHNMRNAMLTLMADKKNPGTIADIPRMFTDTAFQKYKLKNVDDPMVRAFWEQEMAKTSDFHKSEMLGYLISKVGRFIENSMMRNIIGQPKSGFNFKEIMNNKKILIVNLSKGQIGEMNSNLLGLIIVSKLQMAALARADMPEAERKDFYLYIDEFQNYTTDSIATILSEARKYKLNLIMAHQYLGQLIKNNNSSILNAVLGNVGTVISFRIGVEDAETMAKQFEPVFNEFDLVNVDKYNAFMRTLVGNATTRPFNLETLAPQEGDKNMLKKIVELSRMTYGRPQIEVENEIIKRSKLGMIGAPTQPVPPPSK